MDEAPDPVQMLHVAAATTRLKQRTYAYATALASGMHEEADKILVETMLEGPWGIKLFISSLTYDFLQLCVAKDECDGEPPGSTLSTATLQMAAIHATSMDSIRRLTGHDG